MQNVLWHMHTPIIIRITYLKNNKLACFNVTFHYLAKHKTHIRCKKITGGNIGKVGDEKCSKSILFCHLHRYK